MKCEISFVVQILSEMVDPGNWTDETEEMTSIIQGMEVLKQYRKENPRRTFRLIQIQRMILNI